MQKLPTIKQSPRAQQDLLKLVKIKSVDELPKLLTLIENNVTLRTSINGPVNSSEMNSNRMSMDTEKVKMFGA